MHDWIPLYDLREGALFETQDGVCAVKSEYHYTDDNPQPMCILLASGEYAHFPDKERTLVREIDIATVRATERERIARLAMWHGVPELAARIHVLPD